MDQCVYLVEFSNRKPALLKTWFSDNPAASEGCDACIGYSVHDPGSHQFQDGGELDYNEAEKGYTDISQAVDDVIDFAFDGLSPIAVTESAIDPESLED